MRTLLAFCLALLALIPTAATAQMATSLISNGGELYGNGGKDAVNIRAENVAFLGRLTLNAPSTAGDTLDLNVDVARFAASGGGTIQFFQGANNTPILTINSTSGPNGDGTGLHSLTGFTTTVNFTYLRYVADASGGGFNRSTIRSIEVVVN